MRFGQIYVDLFPPAVPWSITEQEMVGVSLITEPCHLARLQKLVKTA